MLIFSLLFTVMCFKTSGKNNTVTKAGMKLLKKRCCGFKQSVFVVRI